MFDLFRSRDKAVRIMLGAILGVVALSMVTYLIPGGWVNGNASTDSSVVANIGNLTVTAPDAQRVITNMMRGRNLPPEILTVYAPQMINNLIADRALAYEAKRLGFEASEADTADAILHSLPQQLFKDGKLISKDLYAQVLAEQGMTIEQFETEMAQQVIISRLRDMIAAGVVISPLDVEQEFRKRNEKAKVEYAMIPSAKYTAEAQAGDAGAQGVL
jgi:peptidyl-prolyl cis-trans isomerase D